ncbi:hypothetical protein [Nibrella viscosa]|uniref:hypothetical protein n=1 Tax=Nibrella viscosa TaxID=1084524 RepID=UPI0031F01D99
MGELHPPEQLRPVLQQGFVPLIPTGLASSGRSWPGGDLQPRVEYGWWSGYEYRDIADLLFIRRPLLC